MTLTFVPRHQLAKVRPLGRCQLFFNLDLHGGAERIDTGTDVTPEGIHLPAAALEDGANGVLLSRREAQLFRQVRNGRVRIPIVTCASGRPTIQGPARDSTDEACGGQEPGGHPVRSTGEHLGHAPRFEENAGVRRGDSGYQHAS